jgi:hypothetical protein
MSMPLTKGKILGWKDPCSQTFSPFKIKTQWSRRWILYPVEEINNLEATLLLLTAVLADRVRAQKEGKEYIPVDESLIWVSSKGKEERLMKIPSAELLEIGAGIVNLLCSSEEITPEEERACDGWQKLGKWVMTIVNAMSEGGGREHVLLSFAHPFLNKVEDRNGKGKMKEGSRGAVRDETVAASTSKSSSALVGLLRKFHFK